MNLGIKYGDLAIDFQVECLQGGISLAGHDLLQSMNFIKKSFLLIQNAIKLKSLCRMNNEKFHEGIQMPPEFNIFSYLEVEKCMGKFDDRPAGSKYEAFALAWTGLNIRESLIYSSTGE